MPDPIGPMTPQDFSFISSQQLPPPKKSHTKVVVMGVIIVVIILVVGLFVMLLPSKGERPMSTIPEENTVDFANGGAVVKDFNSKLQSQEYTEALAYFSNETRPTEADLKSLTQPIIDNYVLDKCTYESATKDDTTSVKVACPAKTNNKMYSFIYSLKSFDSRLRIVNISLGTI